MASEHPPGSVEEAHLQSYLDEFVFRFNRRRSRNRGLVFVTVAELMGHASLETTRLYTRPSPADMQRAVDLLSADN